MTRPADALDHWLLPQLREREQAGLYRSCSVYKGYDGSAGTSAQGRRETILCGNDYLGLATDPRLVRAFEACAQREGSGSGAAHLVSGHRAEHEALEADLAAFTGRPAALFFSTGYMANLGALQALLGRGALVAEDRLNHASLLDAVRLAGARSLRYRHADAAHLGERLEEGARLVVTDGVFSMDGDVAPLAEAAALCRKHGATLVVDDAHGLGVLGPDGRGSLAEADVDWADAPVLVGTLGKAFGAFGAFVSGSAALVEALRQFARTYIYTTAPPPGLAAAAREALRIAREEKWRRERVLSLAQRFRDEARSRGLPLGGGSTLTPIQPVLVGGSATALAWSRVLEEHGLRVTAIRPPTVPEGTARLRVSLTARHGEADIDRLITGLCEAARRYPVETVV